MTEEQLRQPIPPMATAEKAAELETPEQRELIFWLQGRSVALRSVQALAEEFCAEHGEQVRIQLIGHFGGEAECRGKAKIPHVATHFSNLCTKPTVGVNVSGKEGGSSESDYCHRVRILPDLLAEFRAKKEREALARTVETTISAIVNDCLSNARRQRRLICIEGPPGYGKSFAAKSWSDRHLGQARYVRLRGITNRQGFFFTVLEALGFTSIEHSGADKLQRMLQNFIRTSRLMLLIDEAQNLLPAKECSKKRPELLDWIAGETFDEGIPCALLTWADFATRRAAAEQSTSWRAEHLSRRISRYTRLNTPPTEQDFRAVARAMLPDATGDCLDLIAGYAIGSKHFMQAVVDVIAEARDLAETSGRKRVTFADVDSAIEQRTVSDAAQVQALYTPPARPRRNSVPVPAPVMPLPARGSAPAAMLPQGRAITPGERVEERHESMA